MRDREEMEMALTLAETGHLVFSTLHTRSAHQTITRILDSFD
jgi:twitching motility protein PilT